MVKIGMTILSACKYVGVGKYDFENVLRFDKKDAPADRAEKLINGIIDIASVPQSKKDGVNYVKDLGEGVLDRLLTRSLDWHPNKGEVKN